MTARARTALVALVVVGLGLGPTMAGLTAKTLASHTVPVTVTITSVDGVGDDLDGIGRGDADFYAGASIDGAALDAGNSFSTHVDDDAHITPFWTITRSVVVADDTFPAASVTLSIWDHDECDDPFCTDTGVFESNDDQLDIKPGAGETIALTLNLDTGRWSSDVVWPVNCVTGDGGEAVKVCFDISVDSSSGDADGDFLLDGWERNGFNPDGDATVDENLPAMGASPLRKDLFLEIDCLVDGTHTHCPLVGAIQDVVQSFADAPVANVDGTTGVQLHVDTGTLYGAGSTTVLRTGAPAGGLAGNFGNLGGSAGNTGDGGDQIPEAGNLIVDWDGAAGSPATSFYALKGTNFIAGRALVFRYALFVHQTNARAAASDCTSGWAEGIPGNDFLVSLGGTNGATPPGPCWTVDAAGNSVGSRAQQAGTLQHEFGHVIGLGHGGGDGVNTKPNYLSVMNYAFQMCSVTVAAPALPGGCDFSRQDLPDLNEVLPPGLDECVGIAGGLGLGPVDWDQDGTTAGPNLEGVTNCQPPNATNVTANINGDFNDLNNDGDQDPGEANTLGLLTGFDDWNNLRYDFRTVPEFANGISNPVEDEANPEIIERSRAILEGLLEPMLAVDKTGPADAKPGDTLNYTIAIDNNGGGPALGTVLTDTKPDATEVVFDVGTVVAGGQATRLVSFDVDCSTADATVLTNSAAVEAVDMLGNEAVASDSLATTIHAPVLTMSKTATAAVNAGEAITYRITYENTGSGDATSVVITDVLPAGVYYSKALDLGAGPQPDTVTVNGDGTTTLTWQAGTLTGASGPKIIEYTARPGLLFLGGDTLTNGATLTFTNENDCTYAPVLASASTGITVVAPSQDPVGLGFWRNHAELWSAEIRARIQATDQRFDGADGTTPDGMLSDAEVTAVLVPGGNMTKVLEEQLLGTYFNLATRRINAGTLIDSRLTARLGLTNVRDAVLYAQATLLLPVDSANRARYSDATTVLEEINANRSEAY